MWRAADSGAFAGMGRGWRSLVRSETCGDCYGSGGGDRRCDHCEGSGSVIVDKRSGAHLCAARWVDGPRAQVARAARRAA